MNNNLVYDYPLISLGSPYGIGYEIFLLTLKENILNKYYPLACIGSKKILSLFFKLLKFKIDFISVSSFNKEVLNLFKEKKNKFILINIDELINIKNKKIDNIYSISQYLDGLIAYNSIKLGAELVNDKFFTSIVTLPVNKKNINQIDPLFKGHTEFFQKKWKEKNVYMTFISDKINVLLLTTHIPLNQVSKNITKKLIKEGIEYSLKLKKRLKIKKKICFLGLNPHAGEKGLIGKEDLIINDVIQKYGKNQIIGPLPSDTVFTENNIKKYGLFIACYHDQGLIPFKMLSFDNGVNLSFGMKYIRTSVDHGTASDLIGKKKANINSFINAYKLAIKLS